MDGAKLSDLYFYCSYIMVPIGLSILSLDFILSKSREFKKNNSGFQFRVYNAINALAFVWSIIIYRYLPSVGIDIASYSQISCVLFFYISRVLQQIPLLLVPLYSCIYYLTLIYPSKVAFINKKSNLMLCLLFITFVCLVLNIFNAIRYLEVKNSTNVTTYKCISTNVNEVVSLFMAAFLRFFLPFFLTIYFGTSITLKLIKPKLLTNASIKNEIQLAISIVFFHILFLTFNSPLACMQIIKSIYKYIYEYQPESATLITINVYYEYTRILAWSFYVIPTLFNIVFNKIKIKIITKKLNLLMLYLVKKF